MAVNVRLTGAAVLMHGEALRSLWAQTRNLAAIGLAAEQVGVAERALNLAVEYTKERQQFGKAVGSFQGVKHRAAQMLVKVETARSAVYAAAFIADGADDASDLSTSQLKLAQMQRRLLSFHARKHSVARRRGIHLGV
jgi:alkylation response protein AidB-like acyl-CoA dehydrogenase